MNIVYECEDCLWRGDMSNLGHAMDLTVTCPECGSEFIEMLDDEGFLQADDDEDDYLSEGGDE